MKINGLGILLGHDESLIGLEPITNIKALCI